MKLFWAPRTRASRIVWMLEELGVDYERVPVEIRKTENKTDDPEFAAASPMQKVPALADGDVRLAESAAIAMYLADRYRNTDLAPLPDDPARGVYLYWMFFTPGVIEPAMAEKFSRTTPNPTQFGWGSFEIMLKTLRRGIKDKQWLLGDTFSAADVMVGSSTAFLKMFDMLPADPLLDRYVERCTERPAYKRALELDQS